jgi:unsaturated rhamnogalacturonyl hydrolase
MLLSAAVGCIAVIVLVLLIDLVPIWKDWLGRIHIGRHSSKQEWSRSIAELGIKWLKHTPKIKVTDNTRLVAIDMLRGHYSSQSIQHWQEGALLLGLSEQAQLDAKGTTGEQIKQFLDHKFDQEGQWRQPPKTIDCAILAYSILTLHGAQTDRLRPAFDYTWELIQSCIGEDGTVQYRSFMPNYRYVDTLGFICPFLVAYGKRYGKPECIELAVRQLEHYIRNGVLDTHFLPAHAYHLQDATPLGLFGWGRGLGWFAIGLMDTWRELPAQHEAKQRLERFVGKFAKAALAFQTPGGYWSWTVTRKEARPDSSATAVLGWYLTQASQIAELAEPCAKGAERAIGYLMSVTRRNGAVDFSQGDTKDIGVYSTLFNVLPFTQGFCIRMMNAAADVKAKAS